MIKAKNLLMALGAAALLGGLAAQVGAQPENPTDRKDKRREAIDRRREDVKEKRDQKRETVEERKAKLADLKAKETAGTLSDEDKAELERLTKLFDKIKKKHEQLEVRHQKFKDSVDKRRRNQKRMLLRKWTIEVLRKPEVSAELEKHGRRMARLNRLRELAQTEEDNEALARINGIVKRERDRHEKEMTKLKGAP